MQEKLRGEIAPVAGPGAEDSDILTREESS
jgi:hypothetical protein